MSTVEKALSILDLFSESRPNIGPSEIARTLGWDRSTVQRYVNDLTARGFLEQDPSTRTYYLGPALTRLSLVRNRTHPVTSEVERIVSDLVAETGETAHASTLVGSNLTSTTVVETKFRGTRVYVDPAEYLPIHASASGIACLSATPDEEFSELLGATYENFTETTPREFSEILANVRTARERGYARMEGTYERDVAGIASAVLGYNGSLVGAVAVATPAARFNEDVERHISGAVIAAARKMSRLYGATIEDAA